MRITRLPQRPFSALGVARLSQPTRGCVGTVARTCISATNAGTSSQFFPTEPAPGLYGALVLLPMLDVQQNTLLFKCVILVNTTAQSNYLRSIKQAYRDLTLIQANKGNLIRQYWKNTEVSNQALRSLKKKIPRREVIFSLSVQGHGAGVQLDGCRGVPPQDPWLNVQDGQYSFGCSKLLYSLHSEQGSGRNLLCTIQAFTTVLQILLFCQFCLLIWGLFSPHCCPIFLSNPHGIQGV